MSGALFGADAYPAQAVMAHEEGRVLAVAIVGETGAIKACSIVSTIHSFSLDQATCDVLRKGHISPGRDRNGKAVTAHIVVPVRWVLP